MMLPINGDADAIRAVASGLQSSAAVFDGVQRTLFTLRVGAVWDDAAGRRFGEIVGELQPVLDAVADRYAGAVGGLRRLASVLEETQPVATRAIREHDLAQQRYVTLENLVETRLAEPGCTGEGDPRVAALRRDQQEQLRIVTRSQVAHRRALETFEATDREVAARLRALADDAVSDTRTYRFVAATSRVGHDVESLGPYALAAPEFAPVFAAAGAAGTAADAGLLLFYGEGSWREVAEQVAVSAAGVAGGGLVKGAVMGTAQRQGRWVVEESLDTGVRVRRGMNDSAHEAMQDYVASLRMPVDKVAAPARAYPIGAAGLRARARDTVRHQLDERFLDDLRRASAAGTRPMYVAGATLRATPKVRDRVERWRTRDDQEPRDRDLSLSACPPQPPPVPSPGMR